MAISLSTKDGDRFDEMRHVVSVYSADSDHVLRRRFNRLHFYNLYQKHKCLVDLDEKISSLERDVANSNAISGQNPISSTTLPTHTLEGLLLDVDQKLKDFDTASTLYQRSIQAPEIPEYFLNQFRAAVKTEEQDFYNHYDIEAGWSECVLHTATEKGMVHQWFDKCIGRYSFFKWLFIKDRKVQRGLMLRYHERMVQRAEDVFINLGFCALLLMPIFLLSYVRDMHWKLLVVSVFVLLSTLLSSFMATATHKPGLAVVAGYAAILVVFLSGSQATMSGERS